MSDTQTKFKEFLPHYQYGEIKDIIKETGLTRPTIDKFLKGDFDGLTIKNLKKLCTYFALNVWIEKIVIVDSEFYPILDLVDLNEGNNG